MSTQHLAAIVRRRLCGVSILSLIPSRATCDVLLELYVNTFESTNRILHMPSFYEECRQWSAPDKYQRFLLCKLIRL
ncbi:hypothetical protein BDW66DRAFT_137222 [Aspergillus desertorum]